MSSADQELGTFNTIHNSKGIPAKWKHCANIARTDKDASVCVPGGYKRIALILLPNDHFTNITMAELPSKFWPIWNRSCDWIQDWWNVLKLNSRNSPVSRHRLQLASTSDRLDIVLCAIGTQMVWPTPAPMMENMHHRYVDAFSMTGGQQFSKIMMKCQNWKQVCLQNQ